MWRRPAGQSGPRALAGGCRSRRGGGAPAPSTGSGRRGPAGGRPAWLEAGIGTPVPVGRAMPNTPALVGAGAAAIAAGSAAGDNDLAWAEEILRAVGAVVRVPESLLG